MCTMAVYTLCIVGLMSFASRRLAALLMFRGWAWEVEAAGRDRSDL